MAYPSDPVEIRGTQEAAGGAEPNLAKLLADVTAEAQRERRRAEAAEARVRELEEALEQIRSLATHNAERHTGFVHIGRIAALATTNFPAALSSEQAWGTDEMGVVREGWPKSQTEEPVDA